MVTLTPRYKFKVPVDGGVISPDEFAGKRLEEIESLNLWEGNRRKKLGELFNIKFNETDELKEASLNDVKIRLIGDLRRVRRIGSGMTGGELMIEGDVGMRLGEGMKGGTIRVRGNSDSWTGCMMEGGTIIIEGSAGDYTGSSYRGSPEGMRGGRIIIYGNAGSEVGCHMSDGLIRIYGNVGPFAGIHMKGGIILIHGNSDGRAGAEMVNGRIIICGRIPSILPTFTIEDIRPKVRVGEERIPGPFYLFIGDIADEGRGRLYISKEKNPHLNFYEKYLQD